METEKAEKRARAIFRNCISLSPLYRACAKQSHESSRMSLNSWSHNVLVVFLLKIRTVSESRCVYACHVLAFSGLEVSAIPGLFNLESVHPCRAFSKHAWTSSNLHCRVLCSFSFLSSVTKSATPTLHTSSLTTHTPLDHSYCCMPVLPTHSDAGTLLNVDHKHCPPKQEKYNCMQAA